MKIYSHLNLVGFSNCYIIVNEKIHEALIVDPGKVTTAVIENIENGGYKLAGILVSHNHGSHVQGLASLRKIYTPQIYAADYFVVSATMSPALRVLAIGFAPRRADLT